MKTYCVGGCVRDRLLGLPVRDKDWVVVDATPADMQAAGFRLVGKDFPVFLHPQSGEQYALARTSRSRVADEAESGACASAPVTLEEDLQRRDLTINAIAETADGELIDPWGGVRDLEQRVLRHVSPAFAEDPLRVLRVARFSARLAAWDFTVAPETADLMRSMADAGQLDALVPERVWQETVQALAEDAPARYFEVLRQCGALARVFPEIDRLYGVPQTASYHPEIDTGIHTMMVLQQAVRLSPDSRVRFAALVHDLGKALTPREQLPRHIAHEIRSARLVQQLCERLKVPNDFRQLAVHVAQYHTHCHRAMELRPETLHDTLAALDAFRRPGRFEQFLLACEADARGRAGFEQQPYPQADYLRQVLAATTDVATADLRESKQPGEEIAAQLRSRRIAVIKKIRQQRG